MPRPRRLTLPPDPEGQNDRCAAQAFAALARFRALTGTGPEDAVADLLCDLKHWCDRNGMSFDEELHRAKGMYYAETTPDPEDRYTTPRTPRARVVTDPNAPAPYSPPDHPEPEHDVPF